MYHNSDVDYKLLETNVCVTKIADYMLKTPDKLLRNTFLTQHVDLQRDTMCVYN